MDPSWVQDLDVDDSDLHSLRRCKRQRCTDQHRPTTTVTATATATYTSQSQTLDSSVPRNLTSTDQAESPTQFRTIPGPAGIVQAAKLRKTRDIDCLGQEEQLMATQEYIRKVVEDPQEDYDFKRNPWLSAMEFVCADGETSSASSVPLGQINKYQKNGKLNQAVAVIKSCAPNEFGDMTVALKDPTGTVSGTIHHKVLTEGDIRKGICVGSVLILYNVSVFSPSQSTHYLNITKRNLLKVFYKDGGSSQKLTFKNGTIDAVPHLAIQDSAHLPSQDFEQETLSDIAFFVERGAEEITNRMKRSKNTKAETATYCKTVNKDSNMKFAEDEEIFKEAEVIEKVETGQSTQGFTSESVCDEEIFKEAEVIEKVETVGLLTQGLTSESMYAEWTDEQLLALDM